MKHAHFKIVRRTYFGIGAKYRSREADCDIIILAPNKPAMGRIYRLLLKTQPDFKKCRKLKLLEVKP